MHCRLCGSRQVYQKRIIDRSTPKFPVFACRDCSFQFRDIAEDEASSFYNEAYYTGEAAFSYLDERKNEKASRIVWEKRFSILKKNDFSEDGPGRFLDIGCSFGGLMQVAIEAGYNSYGLEVSSFSGSYAAERFGKDHVFIGNCETLSLPENYFSIVSMIEVIEHLFQPRKAVKNIFQSLRKGGVLLLQTADMNGLQAFFGGKNYHYYLPGHLSYFTRKNLTHLLKEEGFSKIRFIGGVEFGLLPKLLKSSASFTKFSDYFKWVRIAYYHYLSKISLFGIRPTSSMVILAWK